MNNKVLWAVIGIVVLVLLGWYFWSSQQVAEGDGEVKVGGLFGLTGFVAFAGETSRNGFTMAIEDAGLDPADFSIEDFQSDLKTVVTASSKLIDVDGVDVVIGPEWNEFSEVIAPVANSKQTLFISPWMVGENEWMKTKYFLAATPSERGQVKKVLEHMEDSGSHDVVLIYTNNAYALGIATIVKDELKNYPDLTLVVENKTNQDAMDYRTELTKIKSSGAKVIYAVFAAGLEAEAFIRQAKELGIDAKVYLPFSRVTELQSAKSFSTLEGVFYPAASTYERTAEFNAKYKARFGSEPAAISGATTYDMTTLVLQAVKAGARNSEEVSTYLRKIKEYPGYSNVITFNKDGQVASEAVELRQFKNGSEVVVE